METPEVSERRQEQEAPGGDAWREVGEQLEALGKSLARAMRVTWESTESQRRLRELRRGVQTLVDDVGEAVREGVPRADADEVRYRAQEAARATKQAGQQAVEDVRPHLLAALQQVNFELGELIERLERGQEPAAPTKIAVLGPESDALPPIEPCYAESVPYAPEARQWPGDEEAPEPDAGAGVA